MNNETKNSMASSGKASIPESVTVEGLKLALEEMRRLYDHRFDSADTLDQKAGTILGSATLVLSLVTTLQLTLAGPSQPWFYWAGLALAFGLYVVMIVLTVWAMEPIAYPTPIKAEWQLLDRRLFRVEYRQALLTMIKAYKDRTITIGAILRCKSLKVRLAIWFLAAIVVVLTLLSLVAARGLSALV